MKYKAQELKKDLITKRCIENDFSMDEACAQIGISKATLHRLESAKIPDMDTFGKVCKWLHASPSKYFECEEIIKKESAWRPFSTETLPEKYEKIVLDYGDGRIAVGEWYANFYLTNVMIRNQHFNRNCRWISLKKIMKL